MARAPSRRFGFLKLPGKSKRWRNESNPDFPAGAEISDRAMSGLSRTARLGRAISREQYAKGIESGAFTYAPRDALRQQMATHGARLNREIPDLSPADRAFLMKARKDYLQGKPGFSTKPEKEQWMRLWAIHEASMAAVFKYPPEQRRRRYAAFTIAAE
jgi:hypothetical protein